MAVHRTKWKSTAIQLAAMMRRKGFNATIYKLKKGYGVSVTRR